MMDAGLLGAARRRWDGLSGLVPRGWRTPADLPAEVARPMRVCRSGQHRLCGQAWTIWSLSVKHGHYAQPTLYRCTCSCHPPPREA